MARRSSINREFVDYIAAAPAEQPVLSIMHTTDLCRFDGIQRNGQLRPSEDRHFKGEKLAYFFYGRPSYCVNPEIKNTRVSSFAPICFILRRQIPWQGIKRLHAFDTGAYHDKRMSQIIHETMPIGDFELSPVPSSAQKLIETFYQSNKDYLDCRPIQSIDDDDLSKQRLLRVQSYNQLIRYSPNDRSDERLHSIELQFYDSVALAGSLLAVVVPCRFFTPEHIRTIRNDWDCDVVGYNLKDVFTPKDLMALLFDKIREVLANDGQIP